VGSTGAGNYYYQFAKPFYEIDSGTICIDNENIENYTLGSLRKQIGGLARCISICRHHFQ
jgi:ABC-type multidrug transport system fused ATPase/permease subunit